MKVDKDCIFCKIIHGEVPTKQVYATESVLAFNDINPVAPIHILIVPREHIPTVNDLTQEHEELIGKMIMAAQKLAEQKGISGSGYRLILNCNKNAGQAVFHIHLHLLGGRMFTWPPG